MDRRQQIEYWLASARHDLLTADLLFQNHHNDWCLYLGHLVLEKTIKAHFVRAKGSVPPKSHNLLALARDAGIQLTDQQALLLQEAGDFNIEARYPDEKLSFYRVCTDEFTREKFGRIRELHQWLTSLSGS